MRLLYPDGSEERFAFVTPNSADARREKRLRAHVMRESIRQKRSGTIDRSQKDSAPMPSHKGRFRLIPLPSNAKPKPKALHRISGLREDEELSATMLNSSINLRHRQEGLTMVPAPGQLDPFDMLPITMGLKQRKLLHFSISSTTQDSMVFDFDPIMMSIASSSPAWLHATLSVVASSHDLGNDMTESYLAESLFHSGEAMRMINQRLIESPKEISDGTIGAIATLANHEIMNGSLKSATAHMNGLEQILKIRGGIQELRQTAGFLQKLVSWSDVCFSSVWGAKPRFARVDRVLAYFEHADELVENSFNSINSFGQADYMCKAMQKLQVMSNIDDSPSVDEDSRSYFGHNVYHIQYNVANIIGESFGDYIIPNRYGYSYEMVSKRLATCLYLNLALRDVPPRAAMHYIIIKTLITSLKQGGQSIVSGWSKDLALLLWILAVGGAAAVGRPERPFFVTNLAVVVIAMDLSSFEEFGTVLKGTAWSDRFGRQHSVALWNELMK